MPKKKLNGVLIFIVVLIWGYLLFKFINPQFGNQQTNEVAFNSPDNFEKKVLFQKDTFLLEKVNYDPFLAKSYTTPNIGYRKKTKSRKPKKKKRTLWPKIAYLGFVKSNTNKNKLGLLRVDNKLHKVKPNDKVSDLYIFKIYNDSIGLSLNGNKKYFKR